MYIEDIVISQHRIRKDLGNLEPLKKSLKTYGLLHPIIVNHKNILISGERRLRAAQELGWTEIDAIVKNISSKEAFLLEKEENICRKDFTEKELSQKYHNIFQRFFSLFHWNNLWTFFKTIFQK